MHVSVQKSTRMTRPRSAAGPSGSELSHAVAPSSDGMRVSANRLIPRVAGRPRARLDAWPSAVLVSPPVAPAIDVFARSLAEIGRADDEDLEALGPGLVAAPHAGRDAHRVPFPELDDLVV